VGVPFKPGHERGVPHLKNLHFIIIGSPSMKMVADRHRHAAYHNKHWRQAFLAVLTLVILNDLEPPK